MDIDFREESGCEMGDDSEMNHDAGRVQRA